MCFYRFVKNLSSDKISLSTLKGEGELTNLELDESVLTDLLALPTWMKLTHAHCNKAAIRIPWTKLKSTPILLVRFCFLFTFKLCRCQKVILYASFSRFVSVFGFSHDPR